MTHAAGLLNALRELMEAMRELHIHLCGGRHTGKTRFHRAWLEAEEAVARATPETPEARTERIAYQREHNEHLNDEAYHLDDKPSDDS